MTNEERYRNALLWAFDRLSVDGGMTRKEQKTTMTEIGRVLCGDPSWAGRYIPSEWADSVKASAQ